MDSAATALPTVGHLWPRLAIRWDRIAQSWANQAPGPPTSAIDLLSTPTLHDIKQNYNQNMGRPLNSRQHQLLGHQAPQLLPSQVAAGCTKAA